MWRRHGVLEHRAWHSAVHVQRADDLQQGDKQLWPSHIIIVIIDWIRSRSRGRYRDGRGVCWHDLTGRVEVAHAAAGQGWAALGKSLWEAGVLLTCCTQGYIEDNAIGMTANPLYSLEPLRKRTNGQ